MTRSTWIATTTAIIAMIPAICCGQIELSPTRVILDMREPSHEVFVLNPTNEILEITTSEGFKLLTSDSLGHIGYDTTQSDATDEKSCAQWITVFPSRFILRPHTSRIVRVMAQPPGILADGEYWGRAAFRTTSLSPLEITGDTTTLRTLLRARITLDIPVIFRKGTVTTGVIIDTVQMRSMGKNLVFLTDFTRTGNSAYRGTLTARIRDGDGEILAERSVQFTTEYRIRQGLAVPHPGDGLYSVEFECVSVKKGAAIDAVIEAPMVTDTYRMHLSPTDSSLTKQ